MASPLINPDLLAGYWSLYDARPDYERAEAFYCGTVDEVYASRSVRTLLAKSGYSEMDNFNFAHIPVDVVVDKLNLKGVTTEDDSTNALLEDLWDYNELGEVLPQLHLDACKFGDAYMMAWPNVDDSGNIIAVDMTIQSPLHVRVFYDPENDRIQTYAIKTWSEGTGKATVVRANLYYTDHIERWVHPGIPTRNAKQPKWVPFSDEDGEAIIPNPTGVIPFFHYRTTRTYGTPDHINAYGPQLSVNKIISSMNAALDFQAFPQRYLLLDPTVDNAGGGTDPYPDFPEDVASRPQSQDNPSNLTANPGDVWEVMAKTAGQFAAADMKNFTEPLDRAIKAMAQATQVPMHAFDSTGDAVSGESRRVADEPVNRRVKAHQLSFGSTHRRAFAFALDLLGINSDGVSTSWEPLESIQDIEGWNTLAAKVAMGVPLDIVLQEAGYSAEQAEEWAAKKDAADKKAQDAIAAQNEAEVAKAKNGGVALDTVSNPVVTPTAPSN